MSNELNMSDAEKLFKMYKRDKKEYEEFMKFVEEEYAPKMINIILRIFDKQKEEKEDSQ